MFSDMFAMPEPGQLAPGGTKDIPIVLTGDTPRAMRALLWILYAL